MRGVGRAWVGAVCTAALVAAAATGPAHASRHHSSLPARFQVGAANLSFTPPLHDAIANDPAECTAPGVHGPAPPQFNGPRAFAYMEPYQDQQGSGHYDLGDNYIDCNGNGRWDGNFIGGGGGGTRYATKEADPVTARAIAVTSGKDTIAVEVVDQEGLFNTYMQQIREKVRADAVP